MNKRGFTLIELLAVVAILAIISLIAVPNVMKIMENNYKEKVVNDANSLIALAKYEVAKNSALRESLTTVGNKVYTLREIDGKGDILNDPKGSAYSRDESYVRVGLYDGIIKYCVYLVSNNYEVVKDNSCVMENYILGDNSKTYVNELKS